MTDFRFGAGKGANPNASQYDFAPKVSIQLFRTKFKHFFYSKILSEQAVLLEQVPVEKELLWELQQEEEVKRDPCHQLLAKISHQSPTLWDKQNLSSK